MNEGFQKEKCNTDWYGISKEIVFWMVFGWWIVPLAYTARFLEEALFERPIFRK